MLNNSGLEWEPPETNVRWGWVAVFGVSGLCLIAFAIALDIAWNVRNILPSVALEFGAALALFAVLVVAEPKVVQHVIERSIPRCTLAEPAVRARVVNLWGGTFRTCDHSPPHYWDLDGHRNLRMEEEAAPKRPPEESHK